MLLLTRYTEKDIQFGPRGDGDSIDEIMFSARTKGFSELIKRRFVLGSYILRCV